MKLQTLKSLSIHCVNKKWDVCKLPWHGLQSLVHKKAAQWMPNATEVNKKKPLALYSSFILLQLLHRYNTPDKIDGYKPACWSRMISYIAKSLQNDLKKKKKKEKQ